MSSFHFKNLNEVLESINHRLQYEGIEIEELHIDENVIHIECDKCLCNDIINVFNHIKNSIECSQIIAQGYICEHIIKESLLDVEGSKIIMNFIVNERFDRNDY